MAEVSRGCPQGLQKEEADEEEEGHPWSGQRSEVQGIGQRAFAVLPGSGGGDDGGNDDGGLLVEFCVAGSLLCYWFWR